MKQAQARQGESYPSCHSIPSPVKVSFALQQPALSGECMHDNHTCKDGRAQQKDTRNALDDTYHGILIYPFIRQFAKIPYIPLITSSSMEPPPISG